MTGTGDQKRQAEGAQRQRSKPELGQEGASGEELGEQERQAEVQEGHGAHHQGIGSSLERREMQAQPLTTKSRPAPSFLPRLKVAKLKRTPDTSLQTQGRGTDCQPAF